MGTKGNGFDGLDTEFLFNSPLHVKHIQQLADWQKDKIFIYAGRGDGSSPMFPAGDLGMITQSSAAHGGYLRNSDFEFGVSNLPYWPDAEGAPLNTIIGGASLWVFQGHSAEEYKAVAAFFSFLSLPMVQAYWHEYTGYVPITTAAMKMMQDLGFYKSTPGRDLPIMQLNGYGKPATPYSKGLRFGSFLQERVIIEEEMENVFAGKKTSKQALDDAVKRGNVLLRRFEKANK
jgi:sn-glycerol 3-phosphate transport system substrate-binding protein